MGNTPFGGRNHPGIREANVPTPSSGLNLTHNFFNVLTPQSTAIAKGKANHRTTLSAGL